MKQRADRLRQMADRITKNAESEAARLRKFADTIDPPAKKAPARRRRVQTNNTTPSDATLAPFGRGKPRKRRDTL